MDAPAPAPEMVTAARRHLSDRYAAGVDRLLWDNDKRPMPDLDAVTAVIAATGHAEALDIASALVVVHAYRLALDHVEHDVLQAAHAAGITDEAIAAVLNLPGEAAVRERQAWLAQRRDLPYPQAGQPSAGVPDTPGAAHAGRRARQAASRAAEAATRRGQLAARPRQGSGAARDHAGQATAHAAESRIVASKAYERAALGLLRAADAQERCAAAYEALAAADHGNGHEFRDQTARYYRAAAEYRQLAAQFRLDGQVAPDLR